MPIKKRKTSFYGWKNAGFLFGVYFCATGIAAYSFSVVFPAMVEALEWGRGAASIAQSTNMLTMGFVTPLMALSINKFGAKKTMNFGLMVMTVALILIGTVTRQLWLWILLWGVAMPLGFSFGSMFPVQTTVMHWFNIKRALVLGIVMTAAPAAGAIIQPSFTWLMQTTGSWQIGWLTGALIVLLALIFSFFIVNKPEDKGQHPDGVNPEEAAGLGGRTGTVRTYRTTDEWTLKEAVKTRAFWLLAVIGLVQGMPVMLIIVHGVFHFTDQGFSNMKAASIISSILIGSGVARFPMGWLADRIEPRWICAGVMSLMIVAFFCLWKAPSLTVLFIMGPVFGLTYGTLLVIMPLLNGNYFQPENYPGIMAVVSPLMTVFTATVPVGAGFINDILGSYDLAFQIVLVFICVGAVSAFLARPPKKV